MLENLKNVTLSKRSAKIATLGTEFMLHAIFWSLVTMTTFAIAVGLTEKQNLQK